MVEELKLKRGLPGVKGASIFLNFVAESLLNLLFSALGFGTVEDFDKLRFLLGSTCKQGQ